MDGPNIKIEEKKSHNRNTKSSSIMFSLNMTEYSVGTSQKKLQLNQSVRAQHPSTSTKISTLEQETNLPENITIS